MRKPVLFIDLRELTKTGHPFRRIVKSIEIWDGGHMIGTLKGSEGGIVIDYNDGRKEEIYISPA